MNISNSSESRTYGLTVELWIQYLFFYFIVEVAAVASNLLIIVLIIFDKKLKTFFFSLVVNHCLVLAIYSLATMIVGVYRINAYFHNELFVISRFNCHALHIFLLLGVSHSSITMLLLAGDRLYSLWKPSSYRRRSFHHGVYIFCGTVIFILLTKYVPTFVGPVSFHSLILCTTATAPFTATVWTFNYGFNTVVMFLSLCLDAMLCLMAYFCKSSGSVAPSASVNPIAAIQTRRQSKLLKVILLLIVVYCFTVVPYNVLLIMSYYFDQNVSSKMVVYGACLNVASTLLDPLILYFHSSFTVTSTSFS